MSFSPSSAIPAGATMFLEILKKGSTTTSGYIPCSSPEHPNLACTAIPAPSSTTATGPEE
jgi:hypothetical protein